MSKQRVSLLKGEKFLYGTIFVLVLANIVWPSFGSAYLSKTNFEVENLKSKIGKQELLNESLNMKINELASLDNIEEVATLYGLEYNNDNVKVVTD